MNDMLVRTVMMAQDLYIRVRFPRLWAEAMAPLPGREVKS